MEPTQERQLHTQSHLYFKISISKYTHTKHTCLFVCIFTKLQQQQQTLLTSAWNKALLVNYRCYLYIGIVQMYNQQECITKSKIKKNYRGKKDKNNKNLIA